MSQNRAPTDPKTAKIIEIIKERISHKWRLKSQERIKELIRRKDGKFKNNVDDAIRLAQGEAIYQSALTADWNEFKDSTLVAFIKTLALEDFEETFVNTNLFVIWSIHAQNESLEDNFMRYILFEVLHLDSSIDNYVESLLCEVNKVVTDADQFDENVIGCNLKNIPFTFEFISNARERCKEIFLNYRFTKHAFDFYKKTLKRYPTFIRSYIEDKTPYGCLYAELGYIDLFRYLNQQYSLSGNNDPQNKYVICTIHELDKLKQLPDDYIFLNLHTHCQYLWIVLAKEGGQWIAYGPSKEVMDLFRHQYGPSDHRLESPRLIIVDHQKNRATDRNLWPRTGYVKGFFLEGGDPATTDWHHVLLGRVLPWLTHRKHSNVALSDYRKDIPIFILRAYVQEQCLLHLVDADREKVNYDNLTYAFAHAIPYTNKSYYDLAHSIPIEEVETSTELVELSSSDINTQTLLKAFDEKYLTFSEDLTTLEYSAANANYTYGHVFYIVCSTPVSRLVIKDIPNERPDCPDDFFNLDVNLKSLSVPSHVIDKFRTGLRSTARNRFLAMTAPQHLVNNVKMRPLLWLNAGAALMRFFQTKGQLINQDFINEVLIFKKKLHASGNPEDYGNLTEDMWTFAQIFQMGTPILRSLFEAMKKRYGGEDQDSKEPGPSLMATFDLNGDVANPTDYIDQLIQHIKGVTYAPLFRSLAFILPDELNAEPLNAIINLIKIINHRKLKIQNELSEIVLYNVNKETLKNLIELLENTDLVIQINIPEWNRNISEHNKIERAAYRALQNKILDNQHHSRAEILEENTANITAQTFVNTTETNTNTSANTLLQDSQLWEGRDIRFPIASSAPRVSQQQQQQQQQEEQSVVSQQTKKQQQQIYTEENVILDRFVGDDDQLLTRDNINHKCNKNWKELTKKIVALSSWQDKTWDEIFSLWVGSDRNAESVIEQIHPDALDKLIENASQFRMGISKEHLPAGFYLTRSTSNRGFVLCYDDVRRNRILRERKKIDAGLCDPFILELKHPAPADEFRGDYRQQQCLLKTSSPTVEELQTLWQYLSKEDQDKTRIENAHAFLKTHKAEYQYQSGTETVILQGFDASGELSSPQSFATCLSSLKSWAQTHCDNSKLLDKLFSDNDSEETRFNEKNLKALGQLFNYYGSDGIKHWLTTAHRIYEAFGPEHFLLWKKCILDVSVNWTEILNKNELDAVAISITTLKNKNHIELWWQFISAQHCATTYVRYADLWHAFTQLLYVAKNLNLNTDIMISYLKQTNDFNGITFLDRLISVLREAEKQENCHQIQQKILDNIHNIDWTHSGYFYACRYDHYPYWDEALQLDHFTSSCNITASNYRIKWNAENTVVVNPHLHALRFASQRMKINHTDFMYLKKILLTDSAKALSADHVQLFMACLSLGEDKLEQFKQTNNSDEQFTALKLNPQNLPFIQWLNKQLNLDGELQAGTFKIKFSDIMILYQAFSDNSMLEELYKLSYPNSLNVINAFSFALCEKWKDKDSTSKIAKLIQFAREKGLSHPMITVYPWLINECDDANTWVDPFSKNYPGKTTNGEEQLNIFKQQLSSIDIASSVALPGLGLIEKVCAEISISNDNGKTRRQLVSELVSTGYKILLQDVSFRPMNEKEINYALSLLNKQLTSSFKEKNIQLCQQLLKNFAVPGNLKYADKLIDGLIALFREIDNKTYFDELGQVLGLLLSQVKNDTHYYSTTQLIRWISVLKEQNADEDCHYPVHILQEVINHASTTVDSTLLNRNLDILNDTGNSQQQLFIKNLITATLPEDIKPTLAKLAIHYNNIDYAKEALIVLNTMYTEKRSAQWLQAASQLILAIIKEEPEVRTQLLTSLTSTFEKAPQLWELSQLRLIDLVVNGKDIANLAKMDLPKNDEDYYSQVILVLSSRIPSKEKIHEDKTNIDNLKRKLRTLPLDEIRILAHYYSTQPNPSSETLLKILYNPDMNLDAKSIIHQFESVELALDNKGNQLRYYSISEKDKDDLLRVLGGIKHKGKDFIPLDDQRKILNLLYYCNTYSMSGQLDNLGMDALHNELLKSIKQYQDKSKDKDFSAAQILVYMREILLRKTGKWVNHTQMLALLYAAIHNNESLIHQIRTGQGKSIITLMRTAFLALNGKVVDVFSAKDSLSKRDHDDFAPVLDAMGIRHAYISEASPANAYQTQSNDGIGAINYQYIGNLSLFESGHSWQGSKGLQKPNKAIRVAWLDECDFILKFEKTQFNYSTSGTTAIYNMDAWVYDATYEFYKQNWRTFADTSDGGKVVSRLNHLQKLYQYICDRASNSPSESTFIRDYVLPALTGDSDVKARLDLQLVKLLNAAHIAKGMKEGQEFCIRPELKKVNDGMTIETRSCKVLINNQICPGATYSDLVQQLLHVRMNRKAAKRGEAPNFFIEPYTQVALSQNVQYILQNNYGKIEGCTGTAGNAEDISYFEKVYGIQHVVKLPTHEEVATKFLEPIYANSEDDQVNKIVTTIINNKSRQPILITCEDDIAVKNLAKKIEYILNDRKFEVGKLIVDTNDSGKSENEILPSCGGLGAVTISSRMGRGTDIQPRLPDGSKIPEGLMVIRTYPAPPNVVKQEQGRQGRNGAQGSCQDILNYKAVVAQYEAYQKTRHKERLAEIMQDQSKHLSRKLEKHQKNNSSKWDDILKNDNKEKYLITRSIEQLKYEISEEQDKYLRRKENIIAQLSGKVIWLLDMDAFKQDPHNRERLCKACLECMEKIDATWNSRLIGKECDSDDIYSDFKKNADIIIHELYTKFPEFSLSSKKEESKEGSPPEIGKNYIKQSPVNIRAESASILAFYQVVTATVNGITQKIQNSTVKDALFNSDELNEFYGSVLALSKSRAEGTQLTEVFKQLTPVVMTKAFQCVSYSAKSQVINLIDLENHTEVFQVLDVFNQFLNDLNIDINTLSVTDIKKYSALLTISMQISRFYLTQKISIPLDLIKLLYTIFRNNFWNLGFEKPDAANAVSDIITYIMKVFASNKIDAPRLINFIHHIIDNSNASPAGAQTRLSACKEYLISHESDLIENLSIVNHVVALALGNRIGVSHLPDPGYLSDPAQNEQFWGFLAQRAPVDKKSCDNLVVYLNEIHFDKEILKAIYAIPPHVSLNYIYNHIKDKRGEYQKRQCINTLKAIKKAGSAWNRFLLNKDIITSRGVKDEDNFKHLINHFESMPPERSELFFDRIASSPIQTLNYIGEMADAFSNNENITPALLGKLADLANQIEKMVNTRHQKFAIEHFKSILKQSSDFTAAIKKLNQFIILINSNAQVAAYEDLQSSVIFDALNIHDQEIIQDSFNALAKLMNIEKSFTNKNDLTHYYITQLNDPITVNNRCLELERIISIVQYDEKDGVIYGKFLDFLKEKETSDNLSQKLRILKKLRRLETKISDGHVLSDDYLHALTVAKDVTEINRRCDHLCLLMKKKLYTAKDTAIVNASLAYLNGKKSEFALAEALSVLKHLRQLERKISKNMTKISDYYLDAILAKDLDNTEVNNLFNQLYKIIDDIQYNDKNLTMYDLCFAYLKHNLIVSKNLLKFTFETFKLLATFTTKKDFTKTLLSRFLANIATKLDNINHLDEASFEDVNIRYDNYIAFINQHTDFVNDIDAEMVSVLYLDGKIDLSCLAYYNSLLLFEAEMQSGNALSAYFKEQLCFSDQLDIINIRCRELVALLNQNNRFQYSECRQAVVKACLDFLKGSIDHNGLSDMFSAIDEVHALQVTKDYNLYFEKFDENNQKRQQIMKSLDHEFANVPNDFKDTCFKKYTALARSQLTIIPKNLNDSEDSRKDLMQCYHEVIKLTREIETIASTPIARPNNVVDEQEVDKNYLSDQKDYFIKQYNRYNSVWYWKSDDRITRAKRLFENLDSCTQDVDNMLTYYKKALQEIATVQNQLLEDDKGKNRNTKGYSRLYDITMQMFIKITQDLLSDKSIHISEKSFIKEILKDQLQKHIKIFFESILKNVKIHSFYAKFNDNNSSFIEKLNKYSMLSENVDKCVFGSKELAELNQFLSDMPLVPKNLVYIYNNLKCLIGMANNDAKIQLSHKTSNF